MVDDFGIKYVGKEHAQHLIDTLEAADYKITIDWEGECTTLKASERLSSVG